MGKDMAKVQATASASHLGVVVKDIDAAKQMLKTLFGIGPWWSVVADVGKDLMIAGEPFKLKVSHARLLENTTIELIEPVSSGSLWSKFLATTGGGVHHICYDVINWQEMVDTVESLGGKMLVAANVFGKKFCYMGCPSVWLLSLPTSTFMLTPRNY